VLWPSHSSLCVTVCKGLASAPAPTTTEADGLPYGWPFARWFALSIRLARWLLALQRNLVSLFFAVGEGSKNQHGQLSLVLCVLLLLKGCCTSCSRSPSFSRELAK
jgi:hypothetical protein